MAKEEEKETININQPVDGDAYRKLKAFATINKKTIAEIVDEAIIDYAAKIKL